MPSPRLILLSLLSFAAAPVNGQCLLTQPANYAFSGKYDLTNRLVEVSVVTNSGTHSCVSIPKTKKFNPGFRLTKYPSRYLTKCENNMVLGIDSSEGPRDSLIAIYYDGEYHPALSITDAPGNGCSGVVGVTSDECRDYSLSYKCTQNLEIQNLLVHYQLKHFPDKKFTYVRVVKTPISLSSPQL